MIKIFVSANLPEVESLKNIMEQSEIPCTIKNQQTAGLAGEVPFVEVFPELWVLRDEDSPKAKDILANWPKAKLLHEKEWTCPNCNETIEKEFTACWRCGKNFQEKSKKDPEQKEGLGDDNKKSGLALSLVIGLTLGVLISSFFFSLKNYYSVLEPMEFDNNGDGTIDSILFYRAKFSPYGNTLSHEKVDLNFDGIFDSRFIFDKRGNYLRGEIDTNQDGKPDIIEYFRDGVSYSTEFLEKKTGKVLKRQFYKFGVKIREEIDLDGDGNFEKVIHFDRYEFPTDPSN